MDLYRFYNLPALHHELKVQFTYVLEAEYLAISKSGSYAAIPTSNEINICLATQGHLCLPSTTLHSVKKIKWCMYALFIKNHE